MADHAIQWSTIQTGASTQPNPHLIILDFHKRNRTNVVNKVIIYYSSVLKFSILKDLSARTELRYLAMKSFLQRSQSQWYKLQYFLCSVEQMPFLFSNLAWTKRFTSDSIRPLTIFNSFSVIIQKSLSVKLLYSKQYLCHTFTFLRYTSTLFPHHTKLYYSLLWVCWYSKIA